MKKPSRNLIVNGICFILGVVVLLLDIPLDDEKITEIALIVYPIIQLLLTEGGVLGSTGGTQ